MEQARSTLQGVDVRAVSVPLRRPVVSKVGRFDQWPLILIDLLDAGGVSAAATLSPTWRIGGSVVPAMRHLAGQAGRRIAPSPIPGGPAVAESGRL